MLQHHLECFLSRLLAQLGEERDVASGERLQRRADRAEDRPRTHRDAADDAEVPGDPKTIEGEGRGRHFTLHEGRLCARSRPNPPMDRPLANP